ncbi:MAG: substrate-binding domain-containing protein [Ahrensia sp.]|nr:substrate-binding domain-containing protein [Ahrensia sp.]
MSNLKKLSENLGLSQTTVSRALNGYPEVNENTRKRVINAARKMNYQPNSNAQRLATGKSKTIGHVVPLAKHDMINPHFSDFIAGAGEAYNKHHYDMLISVVAASEEEDAYHKMKRDGRVDGVIVHAPTANDPRIALLKSLDMPFVVHGRTYHNDDSYNWVDVNNRRAFSQATAHLIGLGHKNIALINGWEHMVFAIKRREGFMAAMQEAGLPIREELMVSDEMIEPVANMAVRRFMRQPEPPTAILCSSMLMAIGAQRALYEMDLRIGRDVSLMAFDDNLSFMNAATSMVSMTVMRSGIRQHGGICANLLIDLIEGRDTPPHILLEAELLLGTSTSAKVR